MSGLKSNKKSTGLTKNSTIECTIDDLQEGVVVISFNHQERLFQGVLLELNRERGTPAGVPFPKDYFTSNCTKPEVLDTSQVPPLNQRHTYFQEVHHGNQHRSLRRIIKPPARFKNSRMSLRPVHRPVLCAKCGIRCEDKSTSQGNNSDKDAPEPSPTNSSSTTTNSASSNSVKRNGIHRKKTHTKGSLGKSETLLGRPSNPSNSKGGGGGSGGSRDTSSPVLQEDPNDYRYESVGSSGIIENAWKRPLAKPLRGQQQQQQPAKGGSSRPSNIKPEMMSFSLNGGRRCRSPPPPVLVPATTFPSSSAVELSYCDKPPLLGLSSSDKASNRFNLGSSKSSILGSQEPSSTTLFRVSKPPSNISKLSDEESKMNNLKLCISKISGGKKRKLDNNCVVLRRNQSVSNLLCVTEMPGESDSQSLPSSSGLTASNIIGSAGGKKKIKRRITKTPLRFRDQNFGKEDGKSYGYLSDEEFKGEEEKVDEENCGQSNHLERLEGPNRMLGMLLPPPPPPPPPPSDPNESLLKISPTLSCSNNASSSSSSGNSNNSNLPQEPAKTPVLKILFDSKGTGMVVQIPPKPTSLKPGSPSLNGSELAESKAARKAMKKAKREARKKHVSEPTKNALVPPPSTPQTASSSSGDHHHGVCSLVPPIRYSELSELHPPESTDWCSMSSDVEISPVSHSGKKRKKVKRRRKDKKSVRTRNEESQEESTSSAIQTPSPPLVDNDEAVSSSTTGPSIKFGSGQYAFANHCEESKDSSSEPKEHSEAQERVLLSLKRLDTNAYTTVSKEIDQVPTSTNKSSEVLNDEVSSDGPVAVNTVKPADTKSLEFFIHEKSNQIFRKGDVVWAQNIDKESEWWPAKILDIITKDSKSTKAKVSWYKLKPNTIVSFEEIFPFKKLFQKMYVTTRRKDCYQQAVDEALSEAHFMNQEDLHID